MKIGGNTQRWENKNYRERGQFTLLAVFEILMEGEKKVGWRLEVDAHCSHCTSNGAEVGGQRRVEGRYLYKQVSVTDRKNHRRDRPARRFRLSRNRPEQMGMKEWKWGEKWISSTTAFGIKSLTQTQGQILYSYLDSLPNLGKSQGHLNLEVSERASPPWHGGKKRPPRNRRFSSNVLWLRRRT